MLGMTPVSPATIPYMLRPHTTVVGAGTGSIRHDHIVDFAHSPAAQRRCFPGRRDTKQVTILQRARRRLRSAGTRLCVRDALTTASEQILKFLFLVLWVYVWSKSKHH